MKSTNPPVFDHIVTHEGNNVQCSVFPIGSWNMDTTVAVSVLSPIDYTGIRVLGMSCMIRSDFAADYIWNLQALDNPATGIVSGGLSFSDQTHVVVQRTTGGFFDSVNFDAVGFNRGYVFIWYIPS